MHTEHQKNTALRAICPTCRVHDHHPLRFPRGFLWGSASSAHQVEGENMNNDWWEWEKRGHVANNDRSGAATDHYHRFEEDFSLARSYYQNAHRLSLEWSRIEPKPGIFSRKELEHYISVLRALKKKRLEPFVTLHHFTNPRWFAERGGWLCGDAPKLFERYVRRTVAALRPFVSYWLTINEPHVYASNGFLQGEWPPERHSYRQTWKVLNSMASAHRRAYTALHALYPKKQKPHVGFAHNFVAFANYGNRVRDYLYAWLVNYVWNEWFFKKTAGTHDFIGLNYYFYERIRKYAGNLGRHQTITASDADRDITDTGWEIYPGGIFRALLELSAHGLPIYITENGLAAINDDRRSRFIVAHLKEVYHALQAGVPVRGYFHWALTDNFEWAKGFAPRFGLVAIDYEHGLKRIPRPSCDVYGAICKQNAITHDLLRFLGHDQPPQTQTRR